MSIELWAPVGAPADGAGDGGHAAPAAPGAAGALLRIKQSKSGGSPCAPISFYAMPCGSSTLAGASAYPVTSLGKPYFRISRVHFNLSHTTGAVLVACRGSRGGDIEHIRPVSERAMRRLADVTTERAFFQSWVRREARPSAAALAWGPCWRRRPRSSLGSDSIFWTPFRAMWRSGHPDGARQAGAQILPG